ncbi:MAG: pyridoxal phosphate-dependent aminotransferase [Candidatus Hodarchaeales archaeon]
MNYGKFINPAISEIPISGIRRVNAWPSRIPEPEWIRLNIGQPDLNTPIYIKKAVNEALEKNQTRYTNLLGEEYLRKEICSYLQSQHGLIYQNDEILVTSGGQSAIYATLKTILAPKDNIVVFFPSYPPYINAIKYAGANLIPITTTIEREFDIPIDKLRAVLSEKSIKALLLISPSNPTGSIISKKTQKGIVKLAEEYDFLLLSDEIYNRIIYSSQNYQSIATYPEAQARTIIFQSFSKMLSMCGFRIGFIAAPKPVIDKIKVIHHTMNICASSLSQYAAFKALSNRIELETSIKTIIKTYNERKNLCMTYLKEIDDIQIKEPQGAFYLFPKVENTDMTKFAKWLKYNYGVLTVPGMYFSIEEIPEHNQYLRICFTTEFNQLRKGMEYICEGIKSFKENSSE